MDDIIFEDIFDVKDIDPDGPKFDRGLYSAPILHWNLKINSDRRLFLFLLMKTSVETFLRVWVIQNGPDSWRKYADLSDGIG